MERGKTEMRKRRKKEEEEWWWGGGGGVRGGKECGRMG